MMAGAGIATAVRLVAGVRLHDGLPAPERGRIYFANHSSHLDFVVVWASLPPPLRARTRPVGAEDYWGKGHLRPLLAKRVFRAVLIARGSTKKSDDPLGRMGAVLESGEDLILFPEGTRSECGQIGPFRSGIYHLAKRFPRAELVPVYLQNLNRLLPKGEFLPVPVIGHIAFGAPIASPADGEGKPEFLARAREAVVSLGPCGQPGDTTTSAAAPPEVAT